MLRIYTDLINKIAIQLSHVMIYNLYKDKLHSVSLNTRPIQLAGEQFLFSRRCELMCSYLGKYLQVRKYRTRENATSPLS